MRIAFYIGSLSQGGAEHVIANLAEYFHQSGDEVLMVTYFKGTQEYVLSDNIKREYADLTPDEISSNRVVNFQRRFQKLRNIWKWYKPDVIVSFIGKTNLMTIATSRGLHIPVVVSVRSVPAREYAGKTMQLGMKLLFPMAAGVVLQTNQAKTYFPGSIQKKAKILPNSINPQFIKPLYTEERSKEIVSVGRLDENKNQKLLLEAFYDLITDEKNSNKNKEISDIKGDETDLCRDWKVVLYGDGTSRKELESYVQEHQMESYVEFKGIQSDIQDKIQKSAVFVLTSRQEGMPNALIEAMALGLACISTDCPCGGPADLIQDGVNGYLIPVDDKDALKNKLKLLIQTEELRRMIGVEAYKIADQLHPDQVNMMWRTYLEAVIKRK